VARTTRWQKIGAAGPGTRTAAATVGLPRSSERAHLLLPLSTSSPWLQTHHLQSRNPPSSNRAFDSPAFSPYSKSVPLHLPDAHPPRWLLTMLAFTLIGRLCSLLV
jgi:hypothetical protein